MARRSALAATLGAMALALPAAGAGAAPVWTAPQFVSAAGITASQPDIAVNARGLAVAVWVRFLPGGAVVEAATRPPGGAWGAPEVISPPVGTAVRPRVEMNASDQAVVVWRRALPGGASEVEWAARAGASGQWFSGSLDPGRQGEQPEVAIDAEGRAIAVWRATDVGTGPVIRGATRINGTWSAAQNVSLVGQSTNRPRVAVTPGGAAVAVWQTDVTGTRFIQAAHNLLFSGGAFGPVQTVSQEVEFASDAEVATDGTGSARVIWRTLSGGTHRIRTASLQGIGAGAWSVPLAVAQGPQALSHPTLAVTPAGATLLAWRRGTGAGAQGIVAVGTINGGSFTANFAGARSELGRAAWRTGAGPTLVTRGLVGGRGTIQAAVRRSDGRWLSGVSLSDPARTASAGHELGADDSGRVTAVWTWFDGTRTRIQHAVLSEATRTCLGQPAQLVGGSFRDELRGTGVNDVMMAGPGDDDAQGFAGADRICLGAGDDTADGGPGNDQILGEGDDDLILGGEGSDTLGGGPGEDILRGGPAGDILQGGSGPDTLFGEAGGDQLSGGPGIDEGFGGTGNDFCAGDVEVTNSCS